MRYKEMFDLPTLLPTQSGTKRSALAPDPEKALAPVYGWFTEGFDTPAAPKLAV
jgi:hypothetical protein